MEQPEGSEQPAGTNPGAMVAPGGNEGVTMLTRPPASACPTCGGAPAPVAGMSARPYVYAIGTMSHRFPKLSVEKEFAHVTGQAGTGLTNPQAMHKVLSQRQNRYLARQLCWVLTTKGVETYIVTPSDPGDLDVLIETLRPDPSPTDIDVVIGVRGSVAPAEYCNGLMVPIVLFDQIYSFDRKSLVDKIVKEAPRPEQIAAKEFSAAAQDLLDKIMQFADNAGATDEHRALNYLAVQYSDIYVKAAEALARNSSLTAVHVRLSPLTGVRKIVDVIFSYTNRSTDVTEKFFVRVDVTDEFLFLVTKLQPYYDR